MKFLHKYTNNHLPSYFSGILDSIYPNHNYETRHREHPVVARFNTLVAKNSIRFALPAEIKVTNELILDKLSTHSFYGFSNYVKKLYIGKYDPLCSIVNCYICKNGI